MADLSSGLRAHRQAVEEFLAAAGTVSAAGWGLPRAPGKWSPGQVTEHVTLAYEANRLVLHGRGPGAAAPRFLRPLIRRFLLGPVLRRGSFIPGSKSPAVFRPSASPAPASDLLPRLRAAATAFEADVSTASAAGDTVDHPFFGLLPLLDFVRLQEIHTRHHRKQVAPM